MRLIDADALMKHIKDVPTWQDCDEYLWKATNYPHGMYNPEDIVSSIENTPAIDAVEVVRCRDCKYWDCYGGEDAHKGDCAELVGLDSCMYENDFCSYGERKNDDKRTDSTDRA